MLYEKRHQHIFKACFDLHKSNKPIDLVTVVEVLDDRKQTDAIGGPAAIIQLSQKVSSSANTKHHCQIAKSHYARRAIMSLGHEIGVRSPDASDPVEFIDELQSKLDGVVSEVIPKQSASWSEILDQTNEEVKALSEARAANELVGIPSGLKAIDEKVGGWLPGELIILAARPSMGKTALAVKFLVSAAAAKFPVAVFQLEMSETQFAKRVIAIEAEHLHANQLYKHGLKTEKDWTDYTDTDSRIRRFPIHLMCRPGMSVHECAIEARKLVHEHGIKIIVVDYLQLMGGTKSNRNSNREQEIAEVSRKLKQLALELQLPVIALSQLSRAVEQRSDKRPMLSDLRESGSIEQDADFVSFLYRSEYYGIEPQNGLPGTTEFIVSKHRNGSLGTVEIAFNDNRVKFSDLDAANAVPELDQPLTNDDDFP